jgi:hypothetical protein
MQKLASPTSRTANFQSHDAAKFGIEYRKPWYVPSRIAVSASARSAAPQKARERCASLLR